MKFRNLLAGTASLALAACQAQPTAKLLGRPNIVVIVADDVGYTDLGAYGSEIPTPNLDRLANQGVKFADFHSGMTCSPTRSMLLTGVDHHRAGLGNMAEELAPNQVGKPGYEGYLNFSVAALPEILKANGYRTYMAGKWHLGMDEGTGPKARGFDRSFASLQGGAGHFANMLPLVGPGKAKYSEDGRPLDELPKDFYSSRSFTDKVIGYLQSAPAQARKQPFFAYLAFTAPHWPIQAPDESVAKFDGNYDAGYDRLFEQRLAAAKRLGLVPASDAGGPRGPDGTAWNKLTPRQKAVASRHMEIYAAMVSDLDRQVGRLTDYLRQSGQLDNTIVVFMSDNGFEGHDLVTKFPEAAEWARQCCDNSLENLGRANSYAWMGPDWGRAGMAPFRIYKGYPTEGGTRVPFIISYPGMARHGLTQVRGHVTDIAPTLLQLAGIAPPSGSFAGRKIEAMSGTSMVPYLSGTAQAIHRADEPFAQELFGKRSIRIGTLKAVQIDPPFGNGRWQLFDIGVDLGETHDLAAARPQDVARLSAAWQVWANRNGVIMPNRVSGY